MIATRTSQRIAALWLLLTLYAPAARAVQPEEATGFRLVRDRFVVVPVRVNGEGPFDFLLDTGTTTTLVSPELAERLGLRPLDRVALVTIAGERVLPRVSLSSVEVGGRAAASGVEALVGRLEAARALDRRIRGVLGQNFLLNFDYVLDYVRRRIEFDPAAAGWRGARVPFVRDEGRLVVSAREHAGAGRPWRMVLDSAAAECVVFGNGAGGRPLGLAQVGVSRVETEAGVRAVSVGRLRALHVGEQRITDLPVAVVQGADGGVRRAEDGLLPTSLFRALYVSHAAGYVIFNPRRADGEKP